MCEAASCNTVANVVDAILNDVNMTSFHIKTATSVTQNKVDHRNQLDLLHARLEHASLSKIKLVNAEY